MPSPLQAAPQIRLKGQNNMDQSLQAAIGHNLTAPMPLCFALDILATLIRSDLKVPEALYIRLTLYLMGAIGLKGGAEIREVGIARGWAAFG